MFKLAVQDLMWPIIPLAVISTILLLGLFVWIKKGTNNMDRRNNIYIEAIKESSTTIIGGIAGGTLQA